MTNPRHPDYETGITDEAAIEGHDLIARAEEEEERMHPDKPEPAMPAVGHPAEGQAKHGKKESTMEKVKHALHLDK
ncbi:uncharacterized protein MAM_08232 [Metarhizium album ARSEF 1941]|uniref:Uncharacterized protein n=1 Tax=Metarhizium album (strain ARSEF 1941) TaxID=1081103 RepID=A0A0B2WLM9_METAS|nr:uncharacterized protein MAM_08232 [Metarhizium album ARSEF 1941]KHN93925.1 hypothetical protein MAM_08232 [Metarhizium album ARSEF 1941]